MAGYNYYNQSAPNMTAGIMSNPYQAFQQPVRYSSPYELQYVTGIEGANAFQLPIGVMQMVLWDTDNDSFYIKKIDEMGRPKVVAWKDFIDHIEPEKKEVSEQPVYNESYICKNEVEEMINQALSQLTVGERGRIVRINELDS